ncbi:hypothetical protein ALC57_06190 [Trachymyrmex cornetzi]|uniref:Pre-rRNA-processing protein Ipi1 N-terminal domain-containing protein n=1 Tax=Trachymyrmex cornetzi TaxID=471704 RepID=A0A151J8X3_9HYME|nr:hypothetical protein ALC57_06190 [Trachymyrmex cornetzi]
MTHIGSRMKEDSLLFLDVLVQNCNSAGARALAKDSHKILPNFLGIPCVAQLITMLRSKSTDVKWRIKVLECLANLFTSIFCTQSIMPPFANLDEDMITIDNCEKETLPIDQDDYSVKRMKRWFKGTFHNASNDEKFLVEVVCLEQNLELCQIHVIIQNWCNSSTLPQLTKLLKTLILKAGPVWYSNCINLNHTRIIGDIMLNSNLNKLHR